MNILKEDGCKNRDFDDYVEISSEGNLKGIDVDLSNAPDLLITVAILHQLWLMEPLILQVLNMPELKKQIG